MKRGTRAKPKTGGNRHSIPSRSVNSDSYVKAIAAARSGNHAAAIVLYRQVIAQQPKHFDAYSLLGSSLREQGDLVGATLHYEKALELQPHSAEVKVHLAEAQRRRGMLQAAIDNCTQAIASQTMAAQAHLVRALARRELGDQEGTISDLRAALARETSALALKLLGGMLMDRGQMTEALSHLEAAAAMDPNDFETFRLIGGCNQGMGNIKGTIDAYSKAIELNPNHALTYVHLSGILTLAGELDTALSAASIAIRLEPTMPGAYFNLAAALHLCDRPEEAIEAYAIALHHDPEFGVARFWMCMLLRQDCRWDNIDQLENQAQRQTYRRGIHVPPFGQLTMTGSLPELFECNKIYAAYMARLSTRTLARYEPRPAHLRDRRVRIGYLSADFRDHATVALLVEVLEKHDKARFELFGYSIGRTDTHPSTLRVRATLDHFVDLNSLSHCAAADRIHSDALDILIDLKGYTFQSRPEILVDRPAPIQVNYLGYPSTMGAAFIDYFIADEIVAPMDHQPFYSEHIVHLPNSYQPNDRKRPIGSFRPTRAMCGLPEDGFVFCCFNANYKINAQMFDIWMRLLQNTPGSVLWLLASNPRAPDNLRREAATRGIDPARLVFAPKLPGDDHLARMSIGDLFLDTLPVGAHTTASEALWTGLPVLTCLGEAFPARVGASLLNAVGLPELIAPTLEAYEEVALRLATNPRELAALKEKLSNLRQSAPLFDAIRYTRNLEAAYIRMIDMRDRSEAPRPFIIEEDPACEPTPWDQTTP